MTNALQVVCVEAVRVAVAAVVDVVVVVVVIVDDVMGTIVNFWLFNYAN